MWTLIALGWLFVACLAVIGHWVLKDQNPYDLELDAHKELYNHRMRTLLIREQGMRGAIGPDCSNSSESMTDAFVTPYLRLVPRSLEEARNDISKRK